MIGLLLWGAMTLQPAEAHRGHSHYRMESYHLHESVRHAGSYCSHRHRVHRKSPKPVPYRMPPNTHWVWVPGHWQGPPSDQEWVKGRWAIQPRGPKRWVPGHWVAR